MVARAAAPASATPAVVSKIFFMVFLLSSKRYVPGIEIPGQL
jgi:hypothetical protein